MQAWKQRQKWLARRTLYLDIFIIFSWGVIALMLYCVYFYAFEPLGSRPPKSSIEYQAIHNNHVNVTDRDLNKGSVVEPDLPAESCESTNTCNNSEGENAELKHRFAIRNIEAQEGIWRASYLVSKLTLAQTILGVLGTVLIGFTLFYTRGALREARAATEAAQDAVRTTEKTVRAAVNVDRAHVFIEFQCELIKSTTTDPDSGKDITQTREFSIKPTLVNYGHTPAVNLKYQIAAFIDNVCDGKRPLDYDHHPLATPWSAQFNLGTGNDSSIRPRIPVEHWWTSGALLRQHENREDCIRVSKDRLPHRDKDNDKSDWHFDRIEFLTKVEYQDVFGQPHEKHTQTTFRVNINEVVPIISLLGIMERGEMIFGVMQSVEAHNEVVYERPRNNQIA